MERRDNITKLLKKLFLFKNIIKRENHSKKNEDFRY
jgi:hypothetical protein